jgi:MFS family permease
MTSTAGQEAAAPPWIPFRHRVFAVLWVATVISNIGTWMQNAGAGWLMTALDPDPLIVSLVQVATALPMFLFALPAGALADIVDRRKLLLVVQVCLAVAIAVLATLVTLERVTPWVLLVFTFIAGVGAALIAPSWQAIVPQLVPREHLAPAVAMNGVGVNISRAIGPALAGATIGIFGLASPFWLNAGSYLAVIAALLWWNPPQQASRHLPAERLGSAMRIGLRHALNNRHLRSTLVRTAGFFLPASAYWALLPLVARDQVSGGPGLYGSLLGAVGAGAVAGAFLLPYLKTWLGADRLVALGTAGTAVALVAFGLVREPAGALAASVLAGLSWICVLPLLNVSAQVALPAWVRGRGLALFVTIQFGAMAAGSATWGLVAADSTLPISCFAAAVVAMTTIPLLWRWKLQTGAGIDMTPSLHWPAPILSEGLEQDMLSNRGPVLTTVEYLVRSEDRDAFLQAIYLLAEQRRRDGAYGWDVFEDGAQTGRFVEIFYSASWLEHLRQHERVTQADKLTQERVNAFHQGDAPPRVTHLLAAEAESGGM